MNIAFRSAGFTSLVLLISGAMTAYCASPQRGEWTLSGSDVPGQVQFSLQTDGSAGRRSNSSSNWKKADFQGLD
jgi:hypothetical protein